MEPAKLNYKIYQGSTFQEIYRWESETKVYVPILNISKDAPCVITTTEPHGVPVGWRFRVTGVGGMKEINTPTDSFHVCTAITTNTLEINQVNSLQYTAYTTGGVVEYGMPVDLSQYSARMQIRETVDSDVIIFTATTENNYLEIDNVQKTISISIPANATALFEFATAVYSLELFTPGGVVVPFLVGNLTLVPEVTR